MYNWITFMCTWNEQSIINQLYFHIKQNFKNILVISGY